MHHPICGVRARVTVRSLSHRALCTLLSGLQCFVVFVFVFGSQYQPVSCFGFLLFHGHKMTNNATRKNVVGRRELSFCPVKRYSIKTTKKHLIPTRLRPKETCSDGAGEGREYEEVNDS